MWPGWTYKCDHQATNGRLICQGVLLESSAQVRVVGTGHKRHIHILAGEEGYNSGPLWEHTTDGLTKMTNKPTSHNYGAGQ